MVIRTTLITGFPGETKEDHEELMQFVADMAFDRLGVFTYSPEEDTPAAAMENQVPEEVKEQRKAELMELQQDISLELDQERIGEELLVFVEGRWRMKTPMWEEPTQTLPASTAIFLSTPGKV